MPTMIEIVWTWFSKYKIIWTFISGKRVAICIGMWWNQQEEMMEQVFLRYCLTSYRLEADEGVLISQLLSSDF